MSTKHPIIAVTGSSGSGTTSVRHAFEEIFLREGLRAAFVEGNAFRRYDRSEQDAVVRQAHAEDRPISLFGPELNLFDRLEGLFREYSRTGTGLCRRYLEEPEAAAAAGRPAGTFTPWEELPGDSDLLFYEGLHGGCIQATWTRREMTPSHNPFIVQQRHKVEEQPDTGVDIAQWVDLLLGVVPSINLEWIQKIHRDCFRRGMSAEAVTATILERLPDYVRYITPQFSFTDINFQRVPLVDVSNPFIAQDVPTQDESVVVIRFRDPTRVDFPDLLRRLNEAFMSRPNTLVVPGGDMGHAMEVICTPMVHELVEAKRRGP